MSSIKQDLQKKIQNYQNILKKTTMKHAKGGTSDMQPSGQSPMNNVDRDYTNRSNFEEES